MWIVGYALRIWNTCGKFDQKIKETQISPTNIVNKATLKKRFFFSFCSKVKTNNGKEIENLLNMTVWCRNLCCFVFITCYSQDNTLTSLYSLFWTVQHVWHVYFYQIFFFEKYSIVFLCFCFVLFVFLVFCRVILFKDSPMPLCGYNNFSIKMKSVFSCFDEFYVILALSYQGRNRDKRATQSNSYILKQNISVARTGLYNYVTKSDVEF